jgi:Protein of unknown function (DUF1524)
MTAKESELSDALKRYTLDSAQQYRTRYLLAKLTQYVDMSYKGIKVPGPLGEYMVADIEHILPNNPEMSLRKAFADASPDAKYDECKIRLGNLTLLEKPINVVASNDFFVAKKAEYLKSKYYLTSSIAQLNTVGKDSSINRINQKLKAFSDWTAESIEERQRLLMALARDVNTFRSEEDACNRYFEAQCTIHWDKSTEIVRAGKAAAASAMDVVGSMRAVGIRYVTFQVRDCNAEHRRFMSMGVWEGASPVTLGEVARISFIRDPDGNFIEISQRASLTGPLPRD